MLKAKKSQKIRVIFLLAFVLAIVSVAGWYLHGHTVSLLQPRGPIGHRERQLMMYAALLGLLVIIPVYTMTFMIVVKYREGNKKKTKYSPEFDHHAGIEFVWWAIPCAIIAVLAVITWQSSHQLDPYKPLASTQPPITIQVVSLDWKWLFIYPAQHIATVNFVQFPENVPVDFEITSDTVMNSFWVPQLGGQIYAMPGMSTQLHLQADQLGDYKGSSANISGKGFAGMTFTARASTQADFNHWVQNIKTMPNHLSLASYNQLAQQSENNPVSYYSSDTPGLYATIVMKYMDPQGVTPQ